MKTFLPVLFALVFLSVPTGCGTKGARSPAGESRAGAVSVSQTGDAQAPASARSVTDSATVPVPAGSVVTHDPETGRVSVTLSADSVLHTESRTDEATAPQAFTPPAPPTPSDEATGRAVWVYRLALFVGGAAALFGLVRGWDFVMAGGGAVALAAVIALFVESHPLLVAVIGGGIALAGGGVWIWHTRLKHTPFASDPVTATP